MTNWQRMNRWVKLWIIFVGLHITATIVFVILIGGAENSPYDRLRLYTNLVAYPIHMVAVISAWRRDIRKQREINKTYAEIMEMHRELEALGGYHEPPPNFGPGIKILGNSAFVMTMIAFTCVVGVTIKDLVS